VKASNDTKYSVSFPLTTTIAEVKAKLVELSEIPVERQRLIYSGRVMKNEETLETYKVKSGNTIHMVKGAASNVSASTGNAGGAAASASGVPRNLASGSGNNPLTGLTGARYAGHVQLPSADLFGPDGGVCLHFRSLIKPLTNCDRWVPFQTPKVSHRHCQTLCSKPK
jgi:ubiquilin